jgi:replicative DNA helicase
MIFTKNEVDTYYRDRVPNLKLIGHELRGPCPVHNGDDPNFVVDQESGLAMCHSRCGRGWDMIGLEMEIQGFSFAQAKESVFELVGRPKIPADERNVEAIYDYVDEKGQLLYQVLRLYGKEFKQRKPDGMGGWHYGLGGVRRVPYRLNKIIEAQFIAIVEGEKDANTLERLGISATCSSGGSGSILREEMGGVFKGKDIAIFPDNDEPGRKYAIKTAEVLKPFAKSIRIVEIPDLPEKGDVTDFVQAGGTLTQLRELYRKSQNWTPDWRFSLNIPRDNDKYLKTFKQSIEEAGGLVEFWNLARLSGLETPFSKLSHALGGGLRRGEVYVLGGNQGSGKSSLALQFAIRAIRQSKPVLYFSMEMDERAIFQRMASMEARVNLNDFRSQQITMRRRDVSSEESYAASREVSEMMRKLAKASAELCERALTVSNKGAITPEHLVEEAQHISKVNKLELIVVDHLQLMNSNENHRSEYEKFTNISRVMKQVAMELQVPLLLVSQTSRHQAHEKRGVLEVSDLRGTGALEEDAAGVLLLYEDAEDRKLASSEGDGSRYITGPLRTMLKVGKNRYGIQGREFVLYHYKTCTRFDETDGRQKEVQTANTPTSGGGSIRHHADEFDFSG